MDIADFDFQLPQDQIAQYPAPDRDGSRLLVYDRAEASRQHLLFRDIVEFLRPEDALVVNETRVLPARLKSSKSETGGKVELLLIRPEGDRWLALARPAHRLRPDTELALESGWRLRVEQVLGRGRILIRLVRGSEVVRGSEGDFRAAGCGESDGLSIQRLLEAEGEVPLPPYIRRPPEEADKERYQTVFARQAGAVAAPTAGLHFTDPLLRRIRDHGVAVVPILLHVGPGTFEPVRVADPRQHTVEAEYYCISDGAAAELRARRRAGGRIVAVGTTVVRALETVVDPEARIRPGSGWTDKVILPPHRFEAVDALVTNFHLPCSSLLLLVAAFAGRPAIMDTYKIAVERGYRFYSYGDAMLIQ
jgi:S-adenosylmethionine:tRNA ribosyltransferase-isomerase